MSSTPNYIRSIREKVGKELIFLNFSGELSIIKITRFFYKKRRKKWIGFPGGAMELGESAAETAIREVFEETGLIVEIEHLIGIYTKYFSNLLFYPSGCSILCIRSVYREYLSDHSPA